MAIFRIRFIILACFGLLLAACDLNLLPAAKIDAEWHRQHLLEGLLSPWLAASPTGNGYMKPAFTREWQPIPKPSTSLILQARNIYSFANGYEVSGDKRYLDAAILGGDFMLKNFHDPVYGGWFMEVAPDGHVVQSTKDTYGDAFVILAFAHLYHATRDERYLGAALETWHVLHDKMRDSFGGFRRYAPRNFEFEQSSRTQNPIMHLFEAMVALYEETGNREALKGAELVGDFVLMDCFNKTTMAPPKFRNGMMINGILWQTTRGAIPI